MVYYKYLPSGRISYLSDELLRFTQPKDLNDPFECLPQKPSQEKVMVEVEEILSRIGWKVDKAVLSKIDVSALFDKGYENVNKSIGIFSLTTKWNNALMWSHYTNSHRGFCIGFNGHDPFFNDYLSKDTLTAKNLKKVLYSKERATITNKSTPSFDPFITKSIDWLYEDEVRLIATLNLSQKTIGMEPFEMYLFKVPHTSIKEIIMGSNIDQAHQMEIENFCRAKGVILYKAKMSELYFDMERVQI